MGLILRQILQIVAAAGTVLALAGCNGMSQVGFDTKMTLGSVSTVDRCTDFMTRAYPNTFIDVTGSHVDTDSKSATVAIQGTRGDVPENSPTYVRNVAVECRFESGVLTGFRWTAGPIRPSAPNPTTPSPTKPGQAR
jgi:hypothetical protein